MKIVLFGYYGFGNVGDEAVLAGLIEGLRRHSASMTDGGAPLELVVIAGDPDRVRAWHGVEAVPRSDWRQIRHLAGTADAWIFGGGSLLQDVTGPRTVPYYLTIVGWAQRRGTPVFFHAQGIGPLERRWSRWLVGRALRRMRRVSVRDEVSARWVRRLAGESVPVTVGADPIFLLEPPSEDERQQTLEAALQQAGTTARPPGGWIGVALRPWDGCDEALPALAAGLKSLAERTGTGVLLLPMQDAQDEAVVRRLDTHLQALAVEAAVVGVGTAPPVRMALLGACRMVVAMRLHALLLAAQQGVGGVALAYDLKVEVAAERLRWRSLPPDTWQQADWSQLLNEAWDEDPSLQTARKAVVIEARRAAEADLLGLVEAFAGVVGGARKAKRGRGAKA